MKYFVMFLCLVTVTAEAQLDKNSKDYQRILKLDQAFFGYYNSCSQNLDKYASYYSEDLEFFHDKDGLSTSKEAIVAATKKNICGKVTRTLLPETVEVHVIPNYGFIEIGFHKFLNKQEGNIESKPTKFIIFWKLINKDLKIAKVISLH